MERALARLLPPAHIVPARLHEAMRYASLEGGKRVRPLLTFAAGELARARPERLEVAAAAVELVHAYSLVHDDLPCMDDDVLRRGKPTVHVEYDEATALLVGDALQSLAFQVVDDVLDADASTATLGKTAGKDSRQGKPTYVSAMGIARARELAQELRHNAHQAVEPLGAGARRLRELADFIVLRKF